MCEKPPLPIVHLNATDGGGGAAIAMRRLHEGLLAAGVDSRIIAGRCDAVNDARAFQIPGASSTISKGKARLMRKIAKNTVPNDCADGVHPHTWNILNMPAWQEADVLNLHNLHRNYFNIRALPEIARGKKVVWTLHDMWALTGHCAYSYDCERWKAGCHDCPMFEEPLSRIVEPELPAKDETRENWNLKKEIYAQIPDFHVVAPSRWLYELAKESILKENAEINYIPNGIDTNQFAPMDKQQARSLLALTRDWRLPLQSARSLLALTRDWRLPLQSALRRGRRLILALLERTFIRRDQEVSSRLMNFPEDKSLVFVSSMHQGRKGGELLAAALEKLQHKDKLALLVNGGNALHMVPSGVEVLNIGRVSQPAILRLAYCAADFFVLPTLSDNLPLTLTESLACGRPCVSFDTGGVGDLVKHEVTGYLARPGNVEDLTRGMEIMLNNPELREKSGARGRALIENEFTIEQQAGRYMKIYGQEIGR
jgi:glycosyltransferase involved in cell wall biosynthesis